MKETHPLRFGPFLLLEPRSREALAASAKRLKLREGDVLIREAGGDDDAYVLLDGSLRVMAQHEGRTLAIVAAPALVGEMAVVQDADRSATVVADTPCDVVRLPGAALRRLMAEQPLFAQSMRERADLLQADAFLKRRSPVRDLPTEIVGVLASRLRPREFAPDQLIEGRDDDIYLVRRGGVERMRDGSRSGPGDFVQRERGERYAAVGETWVYELRMTDVANEIVQHQERVREIAARLGDRTRVRAVEGIVAVPADDLGGVLVHAGLRRAVVSAPVARVIAALDGRRDLASLVASSGRPRGEIVDSVAVLVVAGLAQIAD